MITNHLIDYKVSFFERQTKAPVLVVQGQSGFMFSREGATIIAGARQKETSRPIVSVPLPCESCPVIACATIIPTEILTRR